MFKDLLYFARMSSGSIFLLIHISTAQIDLSFFSSLTKFIALNLLPESFFFPNSSFSFDSFSSSW
uniref:Uncharacterized protein n=1 Tax=Lepeophtheirus salmonis TaxID=72036 RepID=A0A0K2V8T3_LEPSM